MHICFLLESLTLLHFRSSTNTLICKCVLYINSEFNYFLYISWWYIFKNIFHNDFVNYVGRYVQRIIKQEAKRKGKCGQRYVLASQSRVHKEEFANGYGSFCLLNMKMLRFDMQSLCCTEHSISVLPN